MKQTTFLFLIVSLFAGSTVFSQNLAPDTLLRDSFLPGESDSGPQHAVYASVQANNANNGLKGLSYMMAAPDANLMVREINTIADKYTGIVNTRIPIYDMVLTDASRLPITLNYAATGIKLSDNASIVGLGWRLSVGGKITRVVRGQPDDYENPRAWMADINNWTLSNCSSFCDAENWDAQPDLYYFELPGLSGSFVIDKNGQIHTIPQTDIRIVLANDSFRIYDQQGTCYSFDTAEYSSCSIVDGPSFSCKTTWYLDKIEFLNGETIRFKYARLTNDDAYSYIYTNRSYVVVQTRCEDPSQTEIEELSELERDISTHITITEPVYLEEIAYRDQRVGFLYDQKRRDILKMRKLNEIRAFAVRNADTIHVKRFIFNYGVFDNRKLKLTGIEERPSDQLIRPVCNFEYYEDVSLPMDDSGLGIDHWGFCNTNCASPKCPEVVLYPDINDDIPFFFWGSASRDPNLKFTRACSLKKIKYANGGIKEFVYELHNGVDPQYMINKDAGGLRIRKIIETESYAAEPSVYTYEYDGGFFYDDLKSYMINHYIDKYQYMRNYLKTTYVFEISARNLNQCIEYFGASVAYSSVTEHLPNGASVKYMYKPLSEFPDQWPTVYKAQQNAVVQDKRMEKTGRTPKTSLWWGRNMLRCKVAYDADMNVVDSTTYEYKIDSSRMVRIPGHSIYIKQQREIETSLHADPRESVSKIYCIGEYFSVSCPVYLQKQIVHKGRYNLPQITEYNYNNSGQLAYLYQTDYDGSKISTKYRYAEDFMVSDTTTVVGKLARRNCRIPIEEVISKNGKIYSATGRSFRFNENNPSAIVLNCEKTMAHLSPVDQWDFAPVVLDGNNLVFNSLYKDRCKYLDYNTSGQLLCYEDENGMRHSFVYNNSTRPVMTVHNARHSENPAYNEIYFNDFEGQSGPSYPAAKSGTKVYSSLPSSTYTIDKKLKAGTYNVIFWHDGNGPSYPWKRRVAALKVTSSTTFPAVSFGITGLVDDFCIVPRNATFSTCEYVPGWGNVSETDERGFYFKTEYNGLGLPVQIKDMYNTIVKKFEYR